MTGRNIGDYISSFILKKNIIYDKLNMKVKGVFLL